MFQEDEHDHDFMSLAKIEESHMHLRYQIQEATEEKNALKLITQNQLKNINELREKCEECFIVIDQLPENRNTASDRYQEVMTEITKLQNKQLEINELLNTSLKEFDENMQLTNNAKIHFESEINIANQRLLIYESSINEIKNLSEKNITNIKQSINDKSTLVETVKKQLDLLNDSKISLEDELNQLNEIKSKVSPINNDLQQECLEVEEQVRKFREEMKTLESKNLFEQKILNNELERLQIELKSSSSDMQELVGELNSVTAKIEQQKNESILFKNKIDEAKMLSNNLRSSLESKSLELNAFEAQLEKQRTEIINSNNVIKEIAELKTKCSEKETQVQVLILKKDLLMNQCAFLIEKLKIIKEKIDNDDVKYKNVLDETEKNKCVLISVKAKTVQHEKDLDELKKSSEARINSLSAEIEQLKIDNSKLIASIKENEETTDTQQKALAGLKSELEQKKVKLKEKQEKIKTKTEELTKNLEEVKLKKEYVLRELLEKKEAINNTKKFNESIKNMNEKITSEKEKFEFIIQSNEKEKMELQSSCSQQLEQKIQELQDLKNEKTKQWETVRDRAGKAEFSYYRVKSQAQRLKAEVSCLNENLKTYNCENEMLKMLIGWMNNDVSTSDAESTQSKHLENPGVINEIPDYSQNSDSSFDEATESELAEDLVVQKYHLSRVLGQDAARNEVPYYCVSERPILISKDSIEEYQHFHHEYDNRAQTKKDGWDKVDSISSEEAGPSRYNPPLFYQDQFKQNAERTTVRHKIQDTIEFKGGSSEDVKMKKPKTPQKKTLTKRANTRSWKKPKAPAKKKKTILDLVIDSSSN